MQLFPQICDFCVSLLHADFQNLDLRLIAAHGILKLYLQAKLVGLELIEFMSLLTD